MITLSDLWKCELLYKIFFSVGTEIRYEKSFEGESGHKNVFAEVQWKS